MAAAGEACSRCRAMPDHRGPTLNNHERAARDGGEGRERLGGGDGRGDSDGVDDKDVVISRRSASAFH